MTATPKLGRLAVCDDNDVDRMLITLAAAEQGVDIDITGDRAALLELLVQSAEDGRPHDGVLCDLNMPGIGFEEFLASVHAHDMLSELPVVIWSEGIAPRRVEELLALGVDRVEAKRASVVELETLLVNLATEFAARRSG